MKLIKGLFFLLLPFNLLADDVQIITKYACYKIKSYKKATECYSRMMEENPEIKHPWVVKNFKNKKQKENVKQDKNESKKSSSSPKVIFQGPSYQQVLKEWQKKGCPVLLPVVYEAVIDNKARIDQLNEKCQVWDADNKSRMMIKYGTNRNNILKKLEEKNCPKSAEVYREKDYGYFKAESISEIEKVSDSLCQSEHDKVTFLNELNNKSCADTAKMFEQRIVWLNKNSNESQYWDTECQLEIEKTNNSQKNTGAVEKNPPPAASKKVPKATTKKK